MLDQQTRAQRVAIIHYWLVSMRGGERVVEELLRLFPQAEIFTHVADRSKLSPLILGRPLHETFISKLPFARRHYQKYLALMPRALEEIDLSDFDLVISSESGPAKGVIVPPHVPHICYIHTPMRYLWDHYPTYRGRLSGLKRFYFSRLAHRLRIWDVSSAARVDRFIANSNFVAERVQRYYHRRADVVNPPVDLETYRLPLAGTKRSHYLFVSQLVHYKRPDLVIEAFRGLDQRLLVVGEGEESENLARNLPPNVTMLGRVPTENLAALYGSARALIFPGEEDFGIVPVEAMSCGTPVIAYGRGGILDSVTDGVSGLFFERQGVEDIREAVLRFERDAARFDPVRIAGMAQRFSAERFRREIAAIITSELGRHSLKVKNFSAEIPVPSEPDVGPLPRPLALPV
ncbi:glycosyltransferase [Cereibacter sediminicola]|uniref:glycosyltransferase n=1 Tax=Cereibacter sediminicola TaxID=2584941 RepID=UPI0011A14F65|nr:glycosyltransferase [Cereibacter sediminicola]